MTTPTEQGAAAPLPCPFCGAVGLDFGEGSTFRWITAACGGCGATTGETRIQTFGEGSRDEWLADARNDAIAAWNRRASLPSSEGAGWISVDERLPQFAEDAEDEGVKVYTWDGDLVTEDEFMANYEQPAGPAVGGWVRTDDWFASDSLHRVTHWMPRRAPAPPGAAPVAPANITQPYTLAEIEAKIASHDYNAELLLQHAMLLLRAAPVVEPGAQSVRNNGACEAQTLHNEGVQAGREAEQPALIVDVYHAEGDDPFICAVRGKATIDVLTQIEEAIRENADFGKGDGVYSYEPTWFAGQFGEYGQCELRPGWGFDEIGFEGATQGDRT